ncbi:MAG: iron-sulfur cluster-binding domain-containing protein [Bacteroidota bacterium]|nr:iron-sulfur cluster-binding domain-containing protein [Bacteroidota bacterium]
MEHLQLRIVDISTETTDSKTFFVEEINKKKIDYKAGQFLTLLVKLHHKEVRRSYSISSTPGVDEAVFFTIKRIENGELSRRLFDELKVNNVVISLPPTGRFTIDRPESNMAVFIAAGSGITPVFSLIKQVLYQFKETAVLLIYQNHSEQDSIFRNDVIELKYKFPNTFLLKEIFSQPADHNRRSQRLNNNLLEKILLETVVTSSVKFYLCGPASFMRMAQFTLKLMKYSQDCIRQEDFFAIAPPPPFMADQRPHNVTIHHHHKTYNVEVAYPHNILEVALTHHIQLPYSCRGGRCSTCTARCTSGEVKMTINDVLTPKDLRDGLILTCVSFPVTDVEITFTAREES